MRKGLGFLLALMALSVAVSYASIGWAGHQWPCNGASYADNQDITLYMQVWKDGCTPGPGQCADIQATIYYKKASDATYTSSLMTWNSFHESSNDEYQFTVPGSFTESGDDLLWHYELLDLSDNSTYIPDYISCGGGTPPWALHITPATEMDVTVLFAVDMACLDTGYYTSGAVYVAGDFTGWSGCNPTYALTDPDGDLIYTGFFSFPAGSNPYHEYKFLYTMGVSDCNWEGSIGNRSFVIDDSDGSQELPVAAWDNWDCCTPDGPAEITGPGSFCIFLCYSPEALVIPLNVPQNPPVINNVSFLSYYETYDTPCGTDCSLWGMGDPVWELIQTGEGWAIAVQLPRPPNSLPGGFCMTIESILPVEMGAFDAVPGDGQVIVNWNTRSETNVSHFEIVRDGTLLTRINSRGSNASGHAYSWTDREVENGTSYTYTLVGVDLDGSRQDLASESVTPGAVTVTDYALAQNYPNPFNPETTIRYDLAEAGAVSLVVYDLSGRVVAELVNGQQTTGQYSVNFSGQDLPSGVYYYRLTTAGFSATRKMVLMK